MHYVYTAFLHKEKPSPSLILRSRSYCDSLNQIGQDSTTGNMCHSQICRLHAQRLLHEMILHGVCLQRCNIPPGLVSAATTSAGLARM